jgi:3'(2'), 5'-bisphosphate nucleotidase
MPIDAELDELTRIAREAARLVREVYATPFAVEAKGPGDVITRADREANALICAALEQSFPGEAVVAEESVPADRATVEALVRRERVLFVDPLDGTREFAAKNGEFAVMIGLAVAGRAAAGVVVLPTTGQAFVGRVGPKGCAYVEDATGLRRELRPSAERAPANARLLVSRSHRPRLVDPFTTRLGITRLVPCGSVGVKVARLAAGEADLYVHGGGGASLWDACAPEAILDATGGRFTDLDGEPIDYADPELRLPNGIVASNGLLHPAVLDVIRALRDERSGG